MLFSQDRKILVIAILYGVIFAELGVSMPFWPVWLEFIGISGVLFGLLTAAPMVLRALLAPWLASFLAHRNLMGTFIMTTSLLAGIFMLINLWLPLFSWAIPASILLAAATLLMIPAVEGEAISECRARHYPYGRLRSVGSLSFLVANMAMGVLLGALGVEAIPLVTGLLLLTLAWLFGNIGVDQYFQTQAEPNGVRTLLLSGSRLLIYGIVASALIQSSHAAYYVAGSILWLGMGIEPIVVGALWALGVAVEILLFLIGRRASQYLPWFPLMLLAGFLAALRWFAMGFAEHILMIALLQLLHAASFAATHLAFSDMLRQLAKDEEQLAAQTFNGALSGGVFMGFGAVVVGLALDDFGLHTYWLMVAPCLLGLLILIIKKGAHWAPLSKN